MKKDVEIFSGDPWVLEVQVWLNKTYGTVNGWGSVPENGKTGWPTIYGLIRAVQYELGITSMVDNFGTTTEQEWNRQVPSLIVNGAKHNIIQLIEGALRCKGLGQGTFKNEYDIYTEYGINQLKSLAGFNAPTSGFSAMWAKALFDMSAFSFVYGGDRNIQEVQRYLNRNYYLYTGIRPCDGIYQRATNEAIIYGLQAEMGMSVGTANGFFGVGTTSGCPTLSSTQGTQKNIYLLQAALIVNEMYSGAFDGNWNSSLSDAVTKFRKFMKIGNVESSFADMPVIKALLTTTGDVNRTTDTIDTSMQINTQGLANTLYSAGYRTIGRYLTGTVGNDFKPKNLTINEIQLLTRTGFSIFPIYQDGGWNYNYFAKSGQGWADGRIAGAAAYQLGFKKGTTIYFACDYDVIGYEIDTIISYMRDVQQAMALYFPEYKVSLYAPRNVCTRVMESILEINTCFVSDMSSGFSANLGYRMPTNWAFDQYHETTIGGIPIDKVGKSGLDQGQTLFNEPKYLDENQVSEEMKEAALSSIAQKITDSLQIFKNTVGATFKTEQEYVATALPGITVTLKLEQEEKLNDGASGIYEFSNGNVDLKFDNDLKKIQELLDLMDSDDLIKTMTNKLAPICDSGFYSIRLKTDSLFKIGFEVKASGKYEVLNIVGVSFTYKFTVTLGLYFDTNMFPPNSTPELETIKANREIFEQRLAIAGFAGLTTLVLGGAFIIAGGINVVAGTIASAGAPVLLQNVTNFFSNLPSIVLP